MNDGNQLTIECELDDSTCTVNLSGSLTGSSETALMNLLSQMSSPTTIITKEVNQITSCGVRAWLRFMQQARKAHKLTFEQCSREFVLQMNVIPDFRGEANVASVYCGFQCLNCNHNQTVLFRFCEDSSRDDSMHEQLAKVICEKCLSTETEIDTHKEEYFAFMAS